MFLFLIIKRYFVGRFFRKYLNWCIYGLRRKGFYLRVCRVEVLEFGRLFWVVVFVRFSGEFLVVVVLEFGVYV